MDNNSLDPALKEQAEILGTRIAMLLAIAPITDEQRANLAQAVPSMNADQLMEFIRALENSIPDGAINPMSGAEEKKLYQGLDVRSAAYEAAQEENYKKTHAELDELEKLIDEA